MSSSEESFELSSSDSSSDTNDILSSIPQLSDELEFFGLRPLPQITSDASYEMESHIASLVSSLMDSIWNLLHLHQSTIKRHDEAEDGRHRLLDDNKNLRAQVDRLKLELLNKEGLLSTATEKERRLNSDCDKLQHDLKKEKDEVRRLLTQVTKRDSQHAHELRKKEHEILLVQEQLRHNLGLSPSVIHQASNQKQQEYHRKSTHDTCSNSFVVVSPKNAGDSTMLEEKEDLYRKVIYKFENNNQSLIQENVNLRDTYCKLHNGVGLLTQEYASLVKKHIKLDNDGKEFEDALEILPPSVFQMPYDGVKEYNKELHSLSDKYLETLKEVLQHLSKHLELQHSN